MTDYTKDHKKKIAQQAIKLQGKDFKLNEIVDMLNIPLSTLKHWIKDYRDGKFDKQKPPEKKIEPTTKELKALKEIDIRPELAKITKAIKDIGATFQFLNSNMHKVVIRLDSIYSKLTECETISKDLENEFNGD